MEQRPPGPGESHRATRPTLDERYPLLKYNKKDRRRALRAARKLRLPWAEYSPAMHDAASRNFSVERPIDSATEVHLFWSRNAARSSRMQRDLNDILYRWEQLGHPKAFLHLHRLDGAPLPQSLQEAVDSAPGAVPEYRGLRARSALPAMVPPEPTAPGKGVGPKRRTARLLLLGSAALAVVLFATGLLLLLAPVPEPEPGGPAVDIEPGEADRWPSLLDVIYGERRRAERKADQAEKDAANRSSTAELRGAGSGAERRTTTGGAANSERIPMNLRAPDGSEQPVRSGGFEEPTPTPDVLTDPWRDRGGFKELAEPSVGTILVPKRTPACNVTVDDQFEGTTPIKKKLTAGIHVVELACPKGSGYGAAGEPDYEYWTAYVNVEENKRIKVTDEFFLKRAAPLDY